jgi:hypothetical protein
MAGGGCLGEVSSMKQKIHRMQSTGQGRRVGVRVSRPAMFAKSAAIIGCHIFSWGRLSCCFVVLHVVVVAVAVIFLKVFDFVGV